MYIGENVYERSCKIPGKYDFTVVAYITDRYLLEWLLSPSDLHKRFSIFLQLQQSSSESHIVHEKTDFLLDAEKT